MYGISYFLQVYYLLSLPYLLRRIRDLSWVLHVCGCPLLALSPPAGFSSLYLGLLG